MSSPSPSDPESSTRQPGEAGDAAEDKAEDYLPRRFKFFIGGLRGGSSWEWDGKALQCGTLDSVRGKGTTKTITPSADQWKKFWKTMDEVKVWKWRSRYENLDVLDGSSWSLELEYGDEMVRSRGRNGYPSDDDVAAMAGPGESEIFKKFREAVRELVAEGEPEEEYLPRRFKFSIGSPLSGSSWWEWDGKALRCWTLSAEKGQPRPSLLLLTSGKSSGKRWTRSRCGNGAPSTSSLCAMVLSGVLSLNTATRKPSRRGTTALPAMTTRLRWWSC
jgi:hypothetical protein